MADTARCVWCGMIEDMEGWRRERRKRTVSYSYTTCSLCSTLEDQLVDGKTKKAKLPSYRGARLAVPRGSAKR
jgi:hypothetical protein